MVCCNDLFWNNWDNPIKTNTNGNLATADTGAEYLRPIGKPTGIGKEFLTGNQSWMWSHRRSNRAVEFRNHEIPYKGQPQSRHAMQKSLQLGTSGLIPVLWP
jgi:hypothetical protein